MAGTEVMTLGRVRGMGQPAGTGYAYPGGFPGSGGPMRPPYEPMGTPPTWVRNFITSNPVTPRFDARMGRNQIKPFYSKPYGRPGLGPSGGEPIPGLTRGLAGLAGSQTTVTLDEVMATSPEDLEPCLNRIEFGGRSFSFAEIWRGRAMTLHLLGAAVAGYHGYNRNRRSFGWGATWGAFGFFLPVIATGVALFQGVGKR